MTTLISTEDKMADDKMETEFRGVHCSSQFTHKLGFIVLRESVKPSTTEKMTINSQKSINVSFPFCPSEALIPIRHSHID